MSFNFIHTTTLLKFSIIIGNMYVKLMVYIIGWKMFFA